MWSVRVTRKHVIVIERMMRHGGEMLEMQALEQHERCLPGTEWLASGHRTRKTTIWRRGGNRGSSGSSERWGRDGDFSPL